MKENSKQLSWKKLSDLQENLERLRSELRNKIIE